MGALSEFERDLIVERTVAGIQAAKARGVTVGRPCSMSHEQVQHANTLVEGGEPKRKVARLFKVSTATLYRALAATQALFTAADIPTATRNTNELESFLNVQRPFRNPK